MLQSKVVAIDARPLTRKISGIRRYTEELLKLLVKKDDIHWILYTDGQVEGVDELLLESNVTAHSIKCGWFSRFIWPIYSLIWLYMDQPDVYWSPRHHLPISSPKDTVLYLTIHDLVWMENRNMMSFVTYLSEWFWTRRSISKADVILTVSDATSQKLKHFFTSITAPVHIIRNGYSPPKYSSKPRTVDQKRVNNYFLAVGTLEPRKNYKTLISAYFSYIRMGGRKALVIVGNKGWGDDIEKHVRNSGNNQNKVVFLKGISDSELRWCYEHASVLVSVSINEGFGIPLIEAQYYNVPLIVSDILAHREVAGKNAVFVDPMDIVAIAQALLEHDISPSGEEEALLGNDEFIWDVPATKLLSLFLDKSNN